MSLIPKKAPSADELARRGLDKDGKSLPTAPKVVSAVEKLKATRGVK
tara:strand:- start:477 stop:617 length:141 start_codon:yes stop_codon:yes gene_type:complete